MSTTSQNDHHIHGTTDNINNKICIYKHKNFNTKCNENKSKNNSTGFSHLT